MKKLLFVVLILLFGVLMFAAGTLAPTSIKGKVEAAASHLPGLKPAVKAGKVSTPAAKPAADAASGIAEVQAEALNLPAPLPDKGDYALLAGQFSTLAPAQSLAASAGEARLVTTLLQAVEHDGTRWFMVAVGKYGDLDAARTARPAVARSLGLTNAPPVILLPAPSKKG
ncbi:SPOR domain-containing protein [Chitinolyticbacter meiyuanensis]|uniref:SPOR domain-containing protein n=1 Tax=Chitinolyticbacter meiyuanensis TaxID=682798 RepID=UPI0011E5B928|nr:SPOR domain-containing protein [Chitinolyticbacter meiyuanensis]